MIVISYTLFMYEDHSDNPQSNAIQLLPHRISLSCKTESSKPNSVLILLNHPSNEGSVLGDAK